MGQRGTVGKWKGKDKMLASSRPNLNFWKLGKLHPEVFEAVSVF